MPYLKTLINGIILMLFIIFLPNGIIGWFNTIPAKLLKSRVAIDGSA
jgi:ABC-type branched-subunit amino acid transport system permease subunit